MRNVIANGAPASPTPEQQFMALGAKYNEIASTLDPTKEPETSVVTMLSFLRLQMLDLKFDMLAIRLGAAQDPNKPRIVVPGRGH